MTALAHRAPYESQGGVRWGLCVVVAVGLHLGAAAAIWMNRSEPKPIEALMPAMLVDLEPLPTPVAAPAPPPPEPEPEVQKVEEPEPEPPPKPAVVLHKPPRPKPVVRTPERVVEEAPPTPIMAPIPKIDLAAAPQAAAPSPNVLRNWEGAVMAKLDRYKRYPRRAQMRRQEGVVYLRFTVARNGDVTAYSIQRGSGIEALDEETLSLIERAKPLPPPPPEMSQARIELVVPVRYTLR